MIDYYDTIGCCLTCPEAKPSCLCIECKCTKCYWYIPSELNNFEKGKCGYGYKNFKEEIKERIENLLIDSAKDFDKFQWYYIKYKENGNEWGIK